MGHNSKAFLMTTADLLNDICLLMAPTEWTAQISAAILRAPCRKKTVLIRARYEKESFGENLNFLCSPVSCRPTPGRPHLQFLGATVVESYQPPNFPMQLNRTLPEREGNQVRQTVKYVTFSLVCTTCPDTDFLIPYCDIWLLIPQ